VIGSDLFIASAVGTQRFAEWQVQIQADTTCFVAMTEVCSENMFPFCYINTFLPAGYSWVTGIAGDGYIVFFYQLCFGHCFFLCKNTPAPVGSL
jgi:hypothetical protein